MVPSSNPLVRARKAKTGSIICFFSLLAFGLYVDFLKSIIFTSDMIFILAMISLGHEMLIIDGHDRNLSYTHWLKTKFKPLAVLMTLVIGRHAVYAPFMPSSADQGNDFLNWTEWLWVGMLMITLAMFSDFLLYRSFTPFKRKKSLPVCKAKKAF